MSEYVMAIGNIVDYYGRLCLLDGEVYRVIRRDTFHRICVMDENGVKWFIEEEHFRPVKIEIAEEK